MNIYVDREGIEACIAKISSAIEELQSAATTIDQTMGELPEYWQGAAYEKAEATYSAEYKQLLTKTVPENVETFKVFIADCKEAIVDIDRQLSGGN